MFSAPDFSRDEARLHGILLRELAGMSPHLLPGVEEMRIEHMLGDYGRWAEQGILPGPQQLVQQHPELAAQVHAFFSQTGRFFRGGSSGSDSARKTATDP